MKEIVVISGKGGTGKTSIVAAFAALAENAVFADCDVDAADLHLILKPNVKKTFNFSGGKKAFITTDKCIACGKCKDVCNFGAPVLAGVANQTIAKTYQINQIACEGCSLCTYFCPVDAIEFKEAYNGQWFISDTRFGPMLHAKLGIAEENSGKLVSLIKKEAKKLAKTQNRKMIIIDGSPGIGCPVIASISGADMVLVVTEPTKSAQHDLDRVINLTNHFKIPTAICINKYDINNQIAKNIEENANKNNLKVLGKIFYDTSVTKAQISCKSILEFSNNPLKNQIESLWGSILKMLKLE